MHPSRYASLQQRTAALGLPVENVSPEPLRESIVISPAASTNPGAGTNESWLALINRAALPLVRDQEFRLEFHREGPSGGTNIAFRWLVYGYVALGVSRRPEGVGLVQGITTPAF